MVVGDYVNLERAMGAHVRFGGHFVQVRWRRWTVTTRDVTRIMLTSDDWSRQAHVDTTAKVLSRTPDGESVRVVFQLPSGSSGRGKVGCSHRFPPFHTLSQYRSSRRESSPVYRHYRTSCIGGNGTGEPLLRALLFKRCVCLAYKLRCGDSRTSLNSRER